MVVHTLGIHNQNLAEKLSGPHDLRFIGDHWHSGPHGLPVLHGVTAWMVGRIVERVTVASNAVIVVHIEQGELGDADDALIYHERRYTRPDF
ncbi:MAG: Flavin oxidoreductase [Homoserinimonas sp.]|nr:Flavin oxidoreductase [Homoserinimonas sp.]